MPTGKVKFYDKDKGFGFVEAGRTRAVGWKHGRWLDVITMQRALGPGDASPPEEPT